MLTEQHLAVLFIMSTPIVMTAIILFADKLSRNQEKKAD